MKNTHKKIAITVFLIASLVYCFTYSAQGYADSPSRDIELETLKYNIKELQIANGNLQAYKNMFLKLKKIQDSVEIAIEFLPKLEGFRSCPYWDVDHYTIGFGTRSGKNNACIDRYEAKKLMIGEIWFIAIELSKNYPHITLLNKYLFGAIIEFRYNLGVGKFNNTNLAYLLKHEAPVKLIKEELVSNRKNRKRGERELALANWGDFDIK